MKDLRNPESDFENIEAKDDDSSINALINSITSAFRPRKNVISKFNNNYKEQFLSPVNKGIFAKIIAYLSIQELVAIKSITELVTIFKGCTRGFIKSSNNNCKGKILI